MQHDINEIKTKKIKNPKCSLSNGEQEAMKHLVKRKDIIISIAEKGGTENYVKEPTRQLSDKKSYKILQTDSTLQSNKMVNNTLGRFKNENLFSKKTAEGLKVINSKTPKFYITPKIHKENNQGKPLTQSTVISLKFYALLTITFNLYQKKFHPILKISMIL